MATRDYYARREWCLSPNCDVPALIRKDGVAQIAAVPDRSNRPQTAASPMAWAGFLWLDRVRRKTRGPSFSCAILQRRVRRAVAETRKLAAILVSDVAGYSRLAGADEDRTLARLRTLRSDLIDPIISVHHGRVVKRTGDGSIIEFRSVVDAVRCAVEV